MPIRSGWIQILAAVVSGLMVAGLFPPFHSGELIWLALIPLLLALGSLEGKRRAWRGFGLAWLAGAISFGVQFQWLSVVSLLGAIVLPLYLGLFWGIFGAFAASLGNLWQGAQPAAGFGRSMGLAASHAAIWAGQDWLRGWLFTGFGWNPLGVGFHDNLLMAQAADLLGVIGLGMVPVFFQVLLVVAARRILTGHGARRAWCDLTAAGLLIAIVAGYGAIRMATAESGRLFRIKALLVQINIPQDAAHVLWNALDVHLAYEEETRRALENLKAAHANANPGQLPPAWPDWVVWPESALTGKIFRSDGGGWGMHEENVESIAQVRQAGPFQLIHGTNEIEAVTTPDGGQFVAKDGGRIWNSLAVMSPEGQLQTYRKRHLVIFGETIPFVDRFPWLKDIYEQQAGVEFGGSYTPGEAVDPLPIPNARGDIIDAIPSVCFEDTLGRLERLFVRSTPQVIVNVTNDGWFKESAAADQHFANARFRAIELRRPMLRAANTGVTAAINSIGSTAHPDHGRPQILVNASGSHFTRGSLLAELNIPQNPPISLYARIGDWGVIVAAVLAWLVSALDQRRQRRTMAQPIPGSPGPP